MANISGIGVLGWNLACVNGRRGGGVVVSLSELSSVPSNTNLRGKYRRNACQPLFVAMAIFRVNDSVVIRRFDGRTHIVLVVVRWRSVRH